MVLLGIGGLGTKDGEYRRAYFREVVEAAGAPSVVPAQLDDLTLPFQPLQPMPRLLDDLDASVRFPIERTESLPGLRLGVLPEWESVAPLGPNAACGAARAPSRRM